MNEFRYTDDDGDQLHLDIATGEPFTILISTVDGAGELTVVRVDVAHVKKLRKELKSWLKGLPNGQA